MGSDGIIIKLLDKIADKIGLDPRAPEPKEKKKKKPKSGKVQQAIKKMLTPYRYGQHKVDKERSGNE